MGHHGKSINELFEKFKEQEKGDALARGKDYCKPIVKSVCIGGVRFLAGEKRGRTTPNRDEERAFQEYEEEEARAKRLQQTVAEKQAASLAAIESKYCRPVSSQSQGQSAGPDRLRLG